MQKSTETKPKIMLEDEVVLLTTRTLHNLYQFKNGADAVALYCFYCYVAKWQKTNQVKASDSYCMRGLGWGKGRFAKAKTLLQRMNLIEIIMRREGGKIVGWYIKLKYIWKTEKAEEVESLLIKKELNEIPNEITIEEFKNPEIQQVENPTSGKQETNALSANKVNALSSKKNISTIANDCKPHFDFSEISDKAIDKIFYAFKEVNPMISVLIGSSSQRESAKRLFSTLGEERLAGLIKASKRARFFKYAPNITNPVELEIGVGKLENFCDMMRLEHGIDFINSSNEEFDAWVYEEKGWVRKRS